MFTSFNSGKDDDHRWEETPNYVPGRFHAHPRPTPPATPSPSTSSALSPGPPPHRRGVTRRPLLAAINDEEDRQSERSWLLRPGRERVEGWLETWWRRWAVLVGVPCAMVWIWCCLPFPVDDPYVEEPPWHFPWPGEPPTNISSSTASPSAMARRTSGDGLNEVGLWFANEVAQVIGLGKDETQVASKSQTPEEIARRLVRGDGLEEIQTVELQFMRTGGEESETGLVEESVSREMVEKEHATPLEEDPDLPVDANFYFFLFVYYGIYLAVALIFVTKLFDLYRLNWWPSTLGGSISYFVFWSSALLIGFLLHKFDLDGLGTTHSRGGSNGSKFDWERKTVWVALAFATMAMPALACFAKLRADRRQTWRNSLTAVQKSFLERQLAQRMPRSYKRFLWFLLVLTLSLFALVIGQGFATIYLSTLPHSNLDGLVYVWTWILTVQCLNAISNWVLQRKVRSRALVFVFRFYYFLIYHIFYRNMFARLRSPDQALYLQLLSSSWVVVWFPLSCSKTFHRLLKWSIAYDKEWEEHAEGVATMLYLRNLSENVTMVGFLGWVTILHWGPNKQLYPFFSFDSDTDPYNYRLTFVASLVIWFSELSSSFLARLVIWYAYKLDVTNIGLDEFRENPELVVACIWASVHVLMDLLLFLIKLNFR